MGMAITSPEFDLIARHFTWPVPQGVLGVGDDCALMPIQAGCVMATSTDLLVEGVHFFPSVDPVTLGHKALAVNLSDLAAMGARPLGCLLGLSLPVIDEPWLAGFAQGFRTLSQASSCPLIGGDTTRSLSGRTISVTVFGQVPFGQALTRSAARPGDDIWITGTLGAPHVALHELLNPSPCESLLTATRPFLERPEPPVHFASHLPGLAHAALDISDGLLQDVGHILKASRCGACIQYDALPVHPAITHLPDHVLQQAVLAGGDVYQLCFTASPDHAAQLRALAVSMGVQLTHIGQITAQPGLTLFNHGQPMAWSGRHGFDHFA